MITALRCTDVLMTSDDHNVNVAELETMPPKDIVQCLSHLNREKLSMPEADYIWKTIVQLYGGVGNIPATILTQLHWATTAIQPDDIFNITMNSIEIVENFGFDYGLTNEQLTAIAERVREDWGGKEPQDYSSYDLIALRQIICAFNRSEVERIKPQAYREAACVLGKLTNCNPEVLEGLGSLAIQNTAFGPWSKWDDLQKEIVGIVADHIPGQRKDVPIRRYNV